MPKRMKTPTGLKEAKHRTVIVYKVREDSAKVFVRADKYVQRVLPHLDRIGAALRAGGSIESVVTDLGVTKKTFLTWVEDYPELFSTVRVNTIIALAQVESSLFDNCLRRPIVTEKYRLGVVGHDEDGNPIEGLILEEVTVKEVPGDTTAQKFWLVNRSDRWVDEKNINLKGNVGHVGSFAELVEQCNDLEKSLDETDLDGLVEGGGRARTLTKKRTDKRTDKLKKVGGV